MQKTCNLFQKKDVESDECSWAWPTILFAWIILNCTPMWVTIYLARKQKMVSLAGNNKYKPFIRTDVDQWSYVMTVFTHFFFIPRFLFAWFSLTFAMAGCTIGSIGHKRSQEPGVIRTWIFRNSTAWGARGALFAYGVIWLSKKKIVADYQKWLGPDWKLDKVKSFKGAGTYVNNHQSFADILVQLALHNPAPGYVAKEAVRKVWCVGYVAEVILKSLFVSRANS